jgi:sulfonate transport system substrate-binding protein
VKRRELVVLLGILAVALTACGSATSATSNSSAVPPPVSSADLAKVTLKVGDQKGGSKSLLTAAGLLNDAPYHIEWSTFTSGPPLLEAASAGAIDIGSVGNTPPIISAAASANVAVVSAAVQGVTGDAILVPADSPLHSLADLRGKNIAVAKGSSSNGLLLSTLQKAGLSVNDIKIKYLQPSDAYATFTQHGVDAWAIWDPYSSQALLEANARVLVDGTGTLGGTPGNTRVEPPADGSGLTNGYNFQVAGKAALADAGKNSAIRDYVVRIAKAQQWAQTHLDQWSAAWAKETGLSLPVAATAAAHLARRSVAVDDAVVNSEQQLADAFTTAKLVPGKVNFSNFVDRRFNGDVLNVVK